jgi:hypothetical protein
VGRNRAGAKSTMRRGRGEVWEEGRREEDWRREEGGREEGMGEVVAKWASDPPPLPRASDPWLPPFPRPRPASARLT